MAPKKSRISLDERAKIDLKAENPELEFITLSRQEICEREINSSIRLVLFDNDLVSAFLLASAATEIMTKLSEGRPGVGFNNLKAMLKRSEIPSDLEDELHHAMQHPFNFLKHSSSDASVTNDFSVEFTFMVIFTSIESYRVLFGTLSEEMTVMWAVITSWRVHWWKGEENFADRLAQAHKIGLVGATRLEAQGHGRDLLVMKRTGLNFGPKLDVKRLR
ncbi:hypothetical protein [Agrobacterium cavarae]|uniref:hypothetical protein n=1 Tax=Agrobacterium cavarae TaxID=2528239 RepID=UPI003EE54E75